MVTFRQKVVLAGTERWLLFSTVIFDSAAILEHVEYRQLKLHVASDLSLTDVASY